jgi:hypothetical protein
VAFQPRTSFFKNIQEVIVGYERGVFQIWADCYKELLISLGEGIVPEESLFWNYQDILVLVKKFF